MAASSPVRKDVDSQDTLYIKPIHCASGGATLLAHLFYSFFVGQEQKEFSRVQDFSFSLLAKWL